MGESVHLEPFTHGSVRRASIVNRPNTAILAKIVAKFMVFFLVVSLHLSLVGSSLVA